MMATHGRSWLFAALAFLICLPPSFFIGITLIGYARPLPYVSVWLDRLVRRDILMWAEQKC